MTNTELYQYNLLEKRQISITDSGLSIKSKTLFKNFDYNINFENVGTQKITIKKGRNRLLIWGLILTFLAAVLFIDKFTGGNVENGADVFYLIPGLILLVLYFLTFERSIYLVQNKNSNGIKFILNKTSKLELDLFLDELLNRRRNYLLEKYGQLNKNISYETQYQNLLWLKDNAVLTSDEFERKKQELDQLIPTTTVVTGFSVRKD